MNNKTILKCVVLVAFLATSIFPAHAQESDGYNPNSVRPIHESDQLYKTRLWRRMDLKEKQNKPFFSENREITKVIIDAVMAGTLMPYTSDSLNERMTKEQFIENMTIPEMGGGLSEDEIAAGFGAEDTADDGWGDAWGDSGTASAEAAPAEPESYLFLPRDVTVLEIMEDLIFDKERGRQYLDIQAITMILPPEKFPDTGLLREVATFRYKDLIEIWEQHPKEAIWVNARNDAAHLPLQAAFDLRLHAARVVKYSNPEDSRIIDMVDGNRRQSLLESLDYEYKLMVREHELWEY
jgi:gliding motility associated protien GldN